MLKQNYYSFHTIQPSEPGETGEQKQEQKSKKGQINSNSLQPGKNTSDLDVC